MNAFHSVVELYRAAGRPNIIEDRFSFEGSGCDRLRSALDVCGSLDPRFGRFDDAPYWHDGTIDFSWSLASNESGRFYLSVDDFVRRCESLHRGVVPGNFYIADIDHLSSQSPPNENSCVSDQDKLAALPPMLGRVFQLCQLIRLLGELSLTGSVVSEAGKPSHLVFVKPASTGAAPLTVEVVTRISADMISDSCAPDLLILTDLLGNQESGRVRNEEYRAVFRLAIANIGAEEITTSSRFKWIVDNWERILARFRYDVECLVDRLSFEGIKREILDAELLFIGKINSSIVENAAKFLGIPLSLVALTTILSSNSASSDIVVCLGALLVSLIISGTAKAIGYQMGSIDSAFQGTLKSLRARAASDGEVSCKLDGLQETFLDRLRFAKRTVLTFRMLAWIPPCVGLALIAWKYPPEWLKNLMQLLANLLDH
ncbi:TPA: hypothetical protein ACKPYU_000675 [Stenotrophomonas maltophilia]